MTVISILDVSKIDKFDEGQKITCPDSQTGIQDFNKELMTIPKTVIVVSEVNKNGYKFKIKQEGETQLSIIRILYDNVEHGARFQDYNKGWQAVSEFEGRYDKENSELILNCDQENMKLFIRRVKKYITSTPKKFDLKKFIIETDYRIWGIWSAGHELNVTKEGRFGYNMRSTTLPNDITALNIAVEIDGKEFSVTISNKGVISSQISISRTQLTNFYDEVKEYLLD